MVGVLVPLLVGLADVRGADVGLQLTQDSRSRPDVRRRFNGVNQPRSETCFNCGKRPAKESAGVLLNLYRPVPGAEARKTTVTVPRCGVCRLRVWLLVAAAALLLFFTVATYVSAGRLAEASARSRREDAVLLFFPFVIVSLVAVMAAAKPKSARIVKDREEEGWVKGRLPKTAVRPAGDTSIGRRAYLIMLWESEPWSPAEIDELVRAKGLELGCPVEALKSVQVSGDFPTRPDGYVVSMALMACRSAGIPFESSRDTISFAGGPQGSMAGLSSGARGGIGLVTVEINPR